MITILSFNGSPAEYFEDFNDLFDCITTIENLKLIARCPDTKHMDWSFTIYQPKRLASLHIPSRKAHPAIHEAFEENLPLIEICAGSYEHPAYVVKTPNTDIDYLKRKWCLDFCTFHYFILRDYSQMYRNSPRTSKGVLDACMI